MLIQDNYRKRTSSAQKRQRRRMTENSRINIILILLFLAFGIVLCRVAYFQLTQVPKWEAHGNSIYYRNVPIIAERGRILDRNGVMLAMNEPMRNIVVDPYQLPNFSVEEMKLSDKPKLLAKLYKSHRTFRQGVRKLALWLNMPLKELSVYLDPNYYEGKSKGDRYLKRKVPREIAEKIEALALPGIKVTPVAERRYPEGKLFGQVIGITKTDVDSHKRERLIGLEGLEYEFDRYLSGKNGMKTLIQDNSGRYIDSVHSAKSQPVENGHDLVLSIDKNIQSATLDVLKSTVEKHKAAAGTAVVLDAKTGEILAMVNYPDFDPAHFNAYGVKRRRNFAVNDLFEPGSLFKPFIVAKALQEGMVSPNTVLNTEPYMLSGHRIEDVGHYSQLTVSDIIAKSSNVGSSKLISKMDSEKVYNYLHSIGIGEKPQSGFPGEAKGVLYSWKNWRPLDKAVLGYGYGVEVSLLQIARAYSMFTNDGLLLTPTFVKVTGQVLQGKRVISAKVAQQMRAIMTTVTEAGGSGRRGAVQGFKVAGKSGTARKIIDGHYSNRDHLAMFAGYAPADNPRLIVAVVIDRPTENGYYGGVVAAPAFSEIMSNALTILGIAPQEGLDESEQKTKKAQ